MEPVDHHATGRRVPPTTGDADIDLALTDLTDLDHSPLAEHHARLGAVQDLLGSVLDRSRDTVQSPIPGILRPGAPGGQHG